MHFIRKHHFLFLGIALGAVGGYAYYYFIGCANGCTITSVWYNSTVYGAMMGGLLFRSFKKESP